MIPCGLPTQIAIRISSLLAFRVFYSFTYWCRPTGQFSGARQTRQLHYSVPILILTGLDEIIMKSI